MKAPTMTEVALLNTSDRVEHGYTFLYDELFAPIRYMDVRVLEIGFARGRGTRALAEFMPRAVIHSFDHMPRGKHYGRLPDSLKERVKLYVGDQSDPDSIQQVLDMVYQGPKKVGKRGYRRFDLIIDDGSHEPEHQRISFEKLWPEVEPGGMYIIEDFHPFYADGEHPTVNWLFEQVHKLNRYGDKNSSVLLPEVDWILFSYNQAILRKSLDGELD